MSHKITSVRDLVNDQINNIIYNTELKMVILEEKGLKIKEGNHIEYSVFDRETSKDIVTCDSIIAREAHLLKRGIVDLFHMGSLPNITREEMIDIFDGANRSYPINLDADLSREAGQSAINFYKLDIINYEKWLTKYCGRWNMYQFLFTCLDNGIIDIEKRNPETSEIQDIPETPEISKILETPKKRRNLADKVAEGIKGFFSR